MGYRTETLARSDRAGPIICAVLRPQKWGPLRGLRGKSPRKASLNLQLESPGIIPCFSLPLPPPTIPRQEVIVGDLLLN